MRRDRFELLAVGHLRQTQGPRHDGPLCSDFERHQGREIAPPGEVEATHRQRANPGIRQFLILSSMRSPDGA